MHIQKYNKAAVCHMFDHYDRNRPGKKSNIDADKTYQNYNLAAEDQPLPQFDFLLQRMSEVKVQKRKDVIVMCDWAITAPKTLAEHEYDTFFREAYKFMTERYGKENVISAYVHMDESTPHMHYSFIPITMDKKKNKPKVCAKELINKQDLRTIHDDITAHMLKVFGRDIEMKNGATALGNVPVEMLRENRTKVAAVQDSVISNKTAALEKVRNSPAGKVFKKDKVTITGDEIAYLQDVMQQSTAIVDNVDNIIQQANYEKERAERERKRSEEIRQRTEEYAREEQKKAESKTAELEERSKEIDERSEEVEYRAQKVLYKDWDANKKIADVEKREAAVREQEQANRERSKELDEQEKEILQRTEEPFGYYNSLLHVRDDIIADEDEKIRQLTADNKSKDGMIKQLRENIGAMITSHKQEISSLRERHKSELSEKDSMITEKNSIIKTLNLTVNDLKYKLNNAFLVVANIIMAISKLSFKPKSNDNPLYAKLESIHERLINGITEYGASAAESEGFDSIADDIRTKVYLCDEIYHEMYPEEKNKHRSTSLEHDDR